MKKYPFSKKAVQAMLAAAIAFSPMAGFGATQVQAETEYTAVIDDSLIELIEKIDQDYYDKFGNEDKQYLREIQKDIYDNIFVGNWSEYAEQIFTDENDNNDIMLEKMVDLSNAVSKADLIEKIKSFKEYNYEHNIVYNVFKTNISEDQLISYILDVKMEYSTILNSKKLDIIKELLKDEEILGELADSLDKIEDINDIIAEINIKEINIKKETVEALSEIFGSALREAMENVAERNSTINSVLEDRLKSKAEIKAVFSGIVTKYFELQEPKPDPGPGGGGAPAPAPEAKPGEVALPSDSTSVVTEGNNVVTSIPASKVAAIVNLITAEKNTIPVKLEKPAAGQKAQAKVPASLFSEAVKKNAKAMVNVQTDEASYQLPASEINVSDLAKELGVAAGDVEIVVSVNVVNATTTGLKPVSKVIEFEVKAVSGNKEVKINVFKSFVNRVLNLDSEVSTAEVKASAGAALNANNLAGVRINDNGTFSPVPTKFAGSEATIKSLTNGKYTIVENSKTFADVNNGANYFEAHIEKLASKYIINGKTDSKYDPSADITRGEFAALISRGLGLVAKSPAEVKFPDVPATKAVNKNGEINAAVEAGIIQGFPNGDFKPDQPMTRAEAAIMIARAMEFTKVADTKLDKTKKITGLADHSTISNTSRDSILKVYQAGIMSGFQSGEFGPYENTQRDQMAKVLDTFLQASDMIN